MAGPAIAVRQSNRRSGVLDRSPGRMAAGNGRASGGASVGVGRVGPLLPQPASTNSPEETEADMMLEGLWLQLSQDDRSRFGGCFSRMVLKAIQTRRSKAREEQP